jgi:Protein of unknown function (DUF1573)
MSAISKQLLDNLLRRGVRFAGLAGGVGLLVSGCRFGSLLWGEPQPRLVIEAERRDLGEVRAGKIAEARFPLRNAGDLPLHLEVEGGCSCLALQYPATVAPGERAEIVARFGPAATDGGPEQKTLQVTTNEPRAPARNLTLAARVVPFLDLEPRQLEVLYRRGDVLRREVRLVPRPGSGLRVLRAACALPLVRTRLVPPAPGDAQGAYRLQLAIGPCCGPGDLRVPVRIFTSEPQMPETMLAVAALAQEGIVAAVEPDSEGQSLGSVRVFTRSGSLRLLGVETGTPRLRAEVQDRGGSQYAVTLISTGGWPPGPAAAAIRIRTDNPLTPVLTVPFRTTVASRTGRGPGS